VLYSVIVPVYNRPNEIQVLLECLEKQTVKNFDVCVVESGSELFKSDEIVEKFKKRLDVHYYLTGNNGPGLSRNFGFKNAKGDYFIVLDSDVLLDPDFIENVQNGIERDGLDAYGGPDRCHESFLDIEKAFNYSLTSFWTTGGMRGGTTRATKFYPRSFNMGFSRKVYEVTNGFKFGFMGEDMELSHRMIKLGFKTGLIPQAYVYHHRKKDFATFFRYMKFFGKSRINIMKHVPGSLKFIHLIPMFFVLYFFAAYLSMLISPTLFIAMKALFYTYFALVFIDSTRKNNSVNIGFLSMIAVFVQFFGYGLGFMQDFWKRIILGDKKNLKNI
jgi:glycosyltransferase involved in cell wall biosynthesis